MERIKLQFPIPINGVITHDLTLRRPKVRDHLVAGKTPGNDVDKELALFANLIGCAPGELQEMDMADYRQVQDTYTGFLLSRPESSDGLSPLSPAISTSP